MSGTATPGKDTHRRVSLEGCLLWEGPDRKSVRSPSSEEKGVAETSCAELTTTTHSISPCATDRKEVKRLGMKLSLRRREECGESVFPTPI